MLVKNFYESAKLAENVDPLRSNYCVLARIVCTNLGFVILFLRMDKPSQSSHNYV